jgi:hypothetical protein
VTQDSEIESQLRKTMYALAKVIEEYVKLAHGKDLGWFIAMFPLYDTGGRFNYISNAKREDIIVLLKEMTKRFEGMPEVPTTRV